MALRFLKQASVDTWKQRPCNLAVLLKWMCRSMLKEEVCQIRGVTTTQEVLGDSAVGCEAAYQSQATRLTIRQPTDNSLATEMGLRKKATREREPCLPQASTDDQFKSFLPRPQADAGEWSVDPSSWSRRAPSVQCRRHPAPVAQHISGSLLQGHSQHSLGLHPCGPQCQTGEPDLHPHSRDVPGAQRRAPA